MLCVISRGVDNRVNNLYRGKEQRRKRLLVQWLVAVGLLTAGVASARVDCYGPGWVVGDDFCWSCRNVCVITNQDGSYAGIVCGGYRPC